MPYQNDIQKTCIVKKNSKTFDHVTSKNLTKNTSLQSATMFTSDIQPRNVFNSF